MSSKKSEEEVKKIVETKVFHNFFLLIDGTIRICTNNYGSGSRRPNNIRIRIRNTGINLLFSTCCKVGKNDCVPYPVGEHQEAEQPDAGQGRLQHQADL
jgi:hypothetical protein